MPPFLAKQRLLFSVSPSAPCTRATMDVEPRVFPERPSDSAVVFLRASVDETGRIAAVEVLYSTAGPDEPMMVEFLKRNGRLRTTESWSGSLDAFIVLFSDTQGRAGWFVSAARLLS